MSTIRHAHSSSLYSSSPASLADQVERAVEAEDPSANVLTYTEVGSADRTEVLKEADPGWAAWVPSESDVGIMWRKENFDPTWKKAVKLTDKVWTDGHGRKHETWAASAVLEHTDGHVLFVSVCHLPSNVQDGCAFEDNKQAAAWKSAVNGWHDHWNRKRDKHHPDLGMLVADWNIDFHKSCWMDWVGSKFPSLYCTWGGDREPPAGKGTHGDRLIDATWSSVRPTKAKLLQDDSSSDHRPYGEAIPWSTG